MTCAVVVCVNPNASEFISKRFFLISLCKILTYSFCFSRMQTGTIVIIDVTAYSFFCCWKIIAMYPMCDTEWKRNKKSKLTNTKILLPLGCSSEMKMGNNDIQTSARMGCRILLNTAFLSAIRRFSLNFSFFLSCTHTHHFSHLLYTAN